MSRLLCWIWATLILNCEYGACPTRYTASIIVIFGHNRARRSLLCSCSGDRSWELLLHLLCLTWLLWDNHATRGSQRHIPITTSSENTLAERHHTSRRLHIFRQVSRLRTATFTAWLDKGTARSWLRAFISGCVWHFLTVLRVLHTDWGSWNFLLVPATWVEIIAASTFLIVDIEAIWHLVFGGLAISTLPLMGTIIKDGSWRPL